MSNEYKYVDPDYSYTDPNTGVLRNLHGITEHDVLLFVESGALTKRLKQIYENPIKVKGINTLFDIHNILFQDIYAWAGKKRTVEISKNGKQFFPTTHFNNALSFIEGLIIDYKKIRRTNKVQLAHKLAEILDNVNYCNHLEKEMDVHNVNF